MCHPTSKTRVPELREDPNDVVKLSDSSDTHHPAGGGNGRGGSTGRGKPLSSSSSSLMTEEKESSSSIRKTSTGSSSTTRRRERKSVSFDKLEIYGFAKILGDNPSAEGVPIQMDVRPDYRIVVPLQDYEDRRPGRGCRQRRRSSEQLRLTRHQRENYLLAIGYRYDDILDAIRTGEGVQQQRYESYQQSGYYWEQYQIFVETMTSPFSQPNGWGLKSLLLKPQASSDLIKALFLFLLAYLIISFQFQASW